MYPSYSFSKQLIMNVNSWWCRCFYSCGLFTSDSYFNRGLHKLKCRLKKASYTDRSGEHDERIRSDSANVLSRIKGRPSYLVHQKEGFRSFAAEALIIVHQDDECESEILPKLMTEFANILMWAAKHGSQLLASEPDYLLNDISLWINVFKRLMKALQNAKISSQDKQVG